MDSHKIPARFVHALDMDPFGRKFPVVNEYPDTTPVYQKSILKFNIWILPNQDFRSEGTCYPKTRYQVLQGTMDQSFGRRSHMDLKRRFTLILCESHRLLKRRFISILWRRCSAIYECANIPKTLLREAQRNIQDQFLILEQSRFSKSQFVEKRVENNLKRRHSSQGLNSQLEV